MEVGGREVRGIARRIAVLAVAPVGRRQSRERRILTVPPTSQTVQGRRKAPDRCGDHESAPPTQAVGLGQCLQALATLG
jgi:hypothetical protein